MSAYKSNHGMTEVTTTLNVILGNYNIYSCDSSANSAIDDYRIIILNS